MNRQRKIKKRIIKTTYEIIITIKFYNFLLFYVDGKGHILYIIIMNE